MQLNAFDIAFTVDADDILIERDDNLIDVDSIIYKSSYQSGLGDIDFSKNVIQIEGDENVVSHAGLQISLLETVVVRSGHFSGKHFGERKLMV